MYNTAQMYHAMVRGLMRRGFAEMNRTKDAAPIVAQFADDAVFAFVGESRFGGERRGRPAIAAWFAELFANFPDFRLTPLAIVVSGPPWATTVATRFRVEATLPDGTPYRNEGMQFVRVRFGRILEDRIYEDTVKLNDALAQIAAHRAA